MNYFKKIIRYAIPYKTYGFLNIGSNIFYALFSVLSFMALIPMLNVLFEKETALRVQPVWNGLKNTKEYVFDMMNYQITTMTDEHGQMTALLYMVGLIISIFLLKNLFNYAAMFFITFLRNGVLKDIRNDLYEKSIRLHLAYYSEKRKGDMMARISGDVSEVQNSFLSILELIIREPLTIIFTLIGMLALSPKLTLFVFVFIPISGYIISVIGKRLKRDSTIAQKEQGYFLSLIDETLGGLRVIKGFNAEEFFSKHFKDSTQRFYNISNKLLNRQNLASPTSEFLGIVVIAALLWFGGRMVLLENTLDAASFIAFMGLAYNILTPAKAISKAVYSVRKGNAAAERVLEVLETENPLDDKPDALKKETFDTVISFRDLAFKYENDWILQDFNLDVKKGQTVALVGQSGSGKSTIAALVSRFYDVNKGQISIDGKNIKDLTKKSLRGLMGLVTQDAILFHDTVKNNIIFGLENITDEQVIQAAKIANAHDFIMNLPKAYDTNIGDAGGKLSGGQKQRLSIARAVLKNPPIMILDEATSALDTESERLVQDALEHMMQNRTSLVIAHRLSTVQKADLIVVMKEGKIIEQGTHKELIVAKGTYKMLVDMQEL
jgi:subfamily B ATP-binding cassette protein MsbA